MFDRFGGQIGANVDTMPPTAQPPTLKRGLNVDYYMSTIPRLHVDSFPLRARPVLVTRRHMSSECRRNADYCYGETTEVCATPQDDYVGGFGADWKGR